METVTADLGDSCKSEFYTFLTEFGKSDDPSNDDDGDERNLSKYQNECLDILKAGSEAKMFRVDYTDLDDYNTELAEIVAESFLRVEPFLNEALRKMISELTQKSAADASVAFYNLRNMETLRGLRGDHIGQLTAFCARVTRTGEVRPELFLATYTCATCGFTVPRVSQEFKITMPSACCNPACKNTFSTLLSLRQLMRELHTRKAFKLEKELSSLIDWQRIRVQEDSEEIPAGGLPRTMEVILREAYVERIRPGDYMVFTGALVGVPDVSVMATPGEIVTQVNKQLPGAPAEALTGLSCLGVRELTYRMSFLAYSVDPKSDLVGTFNIREENVTAEDMEEECTEDQLAEIAAMGEDPLVYHKLAKSIAPNIYGNEDIKKSILLMLVGGLHKVTNEEGIHLRGDINILIVGDASCGKSQFLKYVASFVPRAVYVSGKSSSAAGLTASVVKDSESGEFCIQAGALMLADNSICCIDEFDKMDQKDQVAIHEAMEQQTISISKAGIHATMNSRASILAAANPYTGRYDKNMTLRRNVALSAPLLSRFDLLHIMVDEPDESKDSRIAQHILHSQRRALDNDMDDDKTDANASLYTAPFTKGQMQLYIRYVRTIKPKLTPQAIDLINASYIKLRQLDTNPGSRASYRITTRQLEGLLRLSEALARIHCSPTVRAEHVREAARLIENSVNTLATRDVELEDMEDERHNPQHQMRGRGPLQQFRQPTLAEAMEGGGSSQPSRVLPERTDQTHATERIDLSSYEREKRILVHILRRQEEERNDQNGDAADYGMTQSQLLKAYFTEQLLQLSLDPTEVTTKMKTLQKILGMLIYKDNVLLVIRTPDRKQGEDEQTYEVRKRKERILAVHPNYTEAQ